MAEVKTTSKKGAKKTEKVKTETSKRYLCFTDEQQALFDSLNGRQKQYALYRAQGYSKSQAYRLAGYGDIGRAGQGGYNLENRTLPFLPNLIDSLRGGERVASVHEEKGSYAKEIDKKASEPPAELEVMGADGNLPDVNQMTRDEAERIQFYRQVANGTIKSKKVTKTYDEKGNLTGRKVEETSTLDDRIKARRELDRILGIRDIMDIGSVSAGEITINIVDCSKGGDDDDAPVVLTNDYEVSDKKDGEENGEQDSDKS